jgi:hypothetical protein
MIRAFPSQWPTIAGVTMLSAAREPVKASVSADAINKPSIRFFIDVICCVMFDAA